MVGRLFDSFEDIGHPVGITHFDVPIAQCRSEAIVDAVETARDPRGDVLLFLFAFHLIYFIATYAKSNLRSDAQPRNHGFVFIVLFPFSEVYVEQQRHINIMRLLQVTNGVVTRVQAFRLTHSLTLIDDIDFSSDDGAFGNECHAHTTGEIWAESGGVVPTDAHGGECRAEHQAATKTLGKER